ncbi:hypothetical protein JTE90_026155 [Oedothorax gibbosus]|uniref:Uncharacterized protein n=1 Tax=Oedothorax gibbosus TaxID=931172 RepID=A0AAV6UZY9_9ARAC|nr:hypothetical protein JTE90_026155 [Oedothorax gibbosus]
MSDQIHHRLSLSTHLMGKLSGRYYNTSFAFPTFIPQQRTDRENDRHSTTCQVSHELPSRTSSSVSEKINY